MEENNGHILLDREFISNYLWFGGAKTLHVFIWILAKANLEDRKYEKETIPRGSVVTTNERIAYSCGLTVANVRTALNHLEESGEITRERRNHYQIISVTKFDEYIEDPE